MEDSKTFTVFTILTSILNLVLLILLVRGLTFYVSNIQAVEANKKLVSEFDLIINEFKYKIDLPREDTFILKTKFNSETSVSSYLEKLIIKTSDKNIQLYKNTVVSSSEKEIVMDIILYGTLENITKVIEEIENKLPLSEITSSSIQVEGNLIKSNINLRIMIDQK